MSYASNILPAAMESAATANAAGAVNEKAAATVKNLMMSAYLSGSDQCMGRGLCVEFDMNMAMAESGLSALLRMLTAASTMMMAAICSCVLDVR